MRKVILVCLAIGVSYISSGQLMAGASFGTFNIPGARTHFKGMGPTVKIEYASDGRASAYLDASLYNKKDDANETTTITDGNGAFVGEATTKSRYSIRHLQMGFKRGLNKDFSEEGFAFFLGAGAAVSFVRTTYQFTLPGYDISDSKFNNTIFGFHFNAGVQYNFAPVILELKANFDLMLKPLTTGTSHVISGSRLGLLIPLTRQ